MLGIIFAPWAMRLVRSLAAEREERIRSQARAEMGAHLHDSVLQTLALVQKRADDPRAVAALARTQERELRAWLAGREGDHDRLAAALEAVAGEVERAHGVPVEIVVVGDRALDGRGEALVAAAREAMVNAAKFGGGLAGRRLRRGLRRRAAGLRARPRPGLRSRRACPPIAAACASRSSGAWTRHGGRAAIHSAPGAGTEVELTHAGDGMTRVAIVDDHGLFRAGVRAELEGHVELVGEAASVAEAVALVAAQRPDVVLLDVHMPDGGGVAVIRGSGRRRRPTRSSSRCRPPTPPRTSSPPSAPARAAT